MPRAETLLAESDGGLVRLTELPGGLRIITEQVPGVRSVAFGVWVGVGSVDEAPEQMGSAHFLEHLLFKGTPTRSALDISSAIDEVGGEMNAFTSKEYTAYYARVLDADADVAIDVICDIVLNANLATSDIEGERGVILEEIAMHDDDHSGVVGDVFSAALFGDTPLGRPVQGTAETIGGVTADAIRSFYYSRYTPDRMVVAVAGNISHDHVVARVSALFAPSLDASVTAAAPRGPLDWSPASTYRAVQRPGEQLHLVLGAPGIDRLDPRRYALSILNTALGGGMSSRLFQEVREKRGLAYTVYSFAERYAGTGAIGVYAGCTPSNMQSVIDVCSEQIAAVVSSGLTSDEIRRGKGQVRGATVLGQEDTFSRMSRLAKTTLVGDELLSIDTIIERVEAVTADEIAAVATDLFTAPMTLAVVGPIDEQGLAVESDS